MKTCTKCGKYSNEFPRRSASRDGLGSICKLCIKVYKHNYAQQKRAPLLKRCTRCTEIKKPDDFYRHKYSKDGLHQWCKVCDNMRAEIYRNTESGRESIYRTRKTTSRFSMSRSRATGSGADWNISKEIYQSIISSPCGYCSTDAEPGFGYGLCRINTNAGFSEDNVTPCCSVCSKMRASGISHELMLKLGPNLRV